MNSIDDVLDFFYLNTIVFLLITNDGMFELLGIVCGPLSSRAVVRIHLNFCRNGAYTRVSLTLTRSSV